MKTKTSNLIERFFKEELNQPPQPDQSSQQTQPQLNQQPSSPQNNQQGQSENPNNQNEELQKVEVYIPLHNGSFTNLIFSTSKNINLKVLYDNVEDDMNIMKEIENNPDVYHQIEPQ
jgi:hypothetical protein